MKYKIKLGNALRNADTIKEVGDIEVENGSTQRAIMLAAKRVAGIARIRGRTIQHVFGYSFVPFNTRSNKGVRTYGHDTIMFVEQID